MLRHGLLCALVAAGCAGDLPDDDRDDLAPDATPGAVPSADAGASSSPDAGASPAPKARVIDTDGSGLNLRAGPGADQAVLRVLPEHAIVVVIAEPAAEWQAVSYQDETGWAHGGFLELYAPGEEPPVDDGWNLLLPWTAGETFRVSQGHNGGSHVDEGSWAWDFATPVGTPIRATHDGVVRLARGDSTVGGCSNSYANDANYVVLDRGDGIETLYLHLDSVAVEVGQTIQRGDVVGASGQTGWSCGAHLHFQVQKSPAGGGGTTWWNQSVQRWFWDTLAPLDPALDSYPISGNDTADVP